MVEFEGWDISRCQKLVAKRYSGGGQDDKRLARRVADEIVGAFTGKPGVSSTEVAFISDRGGAKELFVMDVDGSNARQVTRNKTINEFPSWGPDGDTILYTSYRENRQPGLYVLRRGGRSPGRIFKNLRPGSAQYRGVIDPTGGKVAVVMSVAGATKIFTADRDGRNLRQLTTGKSLEVSPSWSPDGRRIAFVSDRAGGPQVYVMNADGSNQTRLTFQGGYNTGATWSPDGKWIAYESRVGGQFDIWLVDPEGGSSVPLIQHPASDQSATWSPDSRKLIFSSKRRGRADLYVADIDGGAVRRITRGPRREHEPGLGSLPVGATVGFRRHRPGGGRIMRLVRRGMMAALLVPLLVGCVSVAEFRRLERDVDLMQRKDRGTGREQIASVSTEMDELSEQIRQLRGRLDVVENQTRKAAEDARAARKQATVLPPSEMTPPDAEVLARTEPPLGTPQMTARPEPLEKTPALARPEEPSSPPLGTSTARVPEPSAAPSGSDEVQSYRSAYAAWRSGDYASCIDQFRKFLQTHPASPYADDSAYWMADCYFKRGEYRTAILRFDDVVKRYPKGNKAADALYKQGEALRKSGPAYEKAARQAFEQVIADYPDSPRADDARSQIQQLSGGTKSVASPKR